MNVTLHETKKVDLVTRTKESGDYMLVVVVDEAWDVANDFRTRLLAKLNNYAAYFLDGQMRRDYPEMRQDRMQVRISSMEKIPPAGWAYVTQLTDAFRQHRLDIEAGVLD